MADPSRRAPQEAFDELRKFTERSEFDRLLQRGKAAEFDALMRQPVTFRKRAEIDAALKADAAAKAARSRLFNTIARAARFLGIGVEAISFELEIIKAIREREDEMQLAEVEARNAQLQRKLDQRAKEKELRTIVLPATAAGPDLPGEPPNGRPIAQVLQKFPPERPATVPPKPGRPVVPRVFPVEPEFADPEIPRPELPAPAGPLETPAPTASPAPTSRPTVAPKPRIAPPSVLVSSPFRFPSPSTRLKTKKRPLAQIPRLTDVEPRLVSSPQVRALPQTQTQPQPQETDRRQRKQKCFKGLYKERRDGSITKTRWARIDCDTGEEFGTKRRTRKKNQRKKPAQVLPQIASLQGFSIRPG